MNYSDYIKAYDDLAQQAGNIIVANNITITISSLDRINCDFGVGDKVFNFYIIQNPDFLLEHTDEIVFYNEEPDLTCGGYHTMGLCSSV